MEQKKVGVDMEIFVSHANKDRVIAHQFKKMIEITGATVNLVTYVVDPSLTIIEKVKNGIRNCNLGIILWTKNSKDKEWVIQEAGALAITDKPIVVLMDPIVEPPGAMLTGIHYVRMNDIEGLNSLKIWIEKRVSDERFWRWILLIGGGLLLLWLVTKE